MASMETAKRRAITLAAWLGWIGLSLQLYLILFSRWQSEASLMGGLVNFFSFFTVLSNTLVAVVLTCAVTTRPSSGRAFFLQPWVSSGIAASIVVVGVAYSLLLRHLWQPGGLQWLADELLHDVMPVVFLGYWWFCVPKGTLKLTHILVWAIYPVLYFAYVLFRGNMIGLYQYPFIDIAALGYAQVFINALGILVGFVLVSLLLVGLNRWRR